MSEKLEQVRKNLGQYSNKEALAILEALERSKRKDHFIKFFEPIESQRSIFKEFDSTVKVFGVLGGNRSGKTEIGSFIAVAWALGKEYFRGEPAWEYVKDLPIPEPPNNIWVVGLDFPVLRDVIWREKLRYGRQHPPFVPRDMNNVVDRVVDSDSQIFFKNGSIIAGKSADSGREKFQGASVDLVWMDEEPEVDIFDECYQRTSDCAGKILLTLTPLTDIASGIRTPWVFDLYDDMRAGKTDDVKFVKLSVLDNPFVPEAEKAKLRDKWSGHVEENARLYGEFVQRSGMVYHEWDKRKHLVKPFKIPNGWTKVVALDPAATGVTAGLWGAYDPHGNLYLYREYYEKKLVVSDHAKNLLIVNGGEHVDIWLIDPFWARQKNAETHRTNLQLYRDAGIPCRIPVLDEDYGQNVSREFIKATTEPTSRHPKVYVFTSLKNFVWEIEHYTWAVFGKGEMKGLSKEKPVKRNDHLMNAFQYMSTLRLKAKESREKPTREQLLKAVSLNSYT